MRRGVGLETGSRQQRRVPVLLLPKSPRRLNATSAECQTAKRLGTMARVAAPTALDGGTVDAWLYQGISCRIASSRRRTMSATGVDGFAVWHRSCLIVAELSFFGSATLPAAARHGAPPAAGDAAADASGVAKHRRFHRQAPWALLIVVVTGSILDGAATLAIVPSRSL